MDESTIWYLFGVISSAQAVALISLTPLKIKYGNLSKINAIVDNIGNYGTKIKSTILRVAFAEGMRDIFQKINDVLPDNLKLTPAILMSNAFADWDYEFVSSFWMNNINPKNAVPILTEAQRVYSTIHTTDAYYFSRRCKDLLDLINGM